MGHPTHGVVVRMKCVKYKALIKGSEVIRIQRAGQTGGVCARKGARQAVCGEPQVTVAASVV